jgi:hypothetical protein
MADREPIKHVSLNHLIAVCELIKKYNSYVSHVLVLIQMKARRKQTTYDLLSHETYTYTRGVARTLLWVNKRTN